MGVRVEPEITSPVSDHVPRRLVEYELQHDILAGLNPCDEPGLPVPRCVRSAPRSLRLVVPIPARVEHRLIERGVRMGDRAVEESFVLVLARCSTRRGRRCRRLEFEALQIPLLHERAKARGVERAAIRTDRESPNWVRFNLVLHVKTKIAVPTALNY